MIGGLFGALSVKIGGDADQPLDLGRRAASRDCCSAICATMRPTFGYIPAPSLWLMNTLGSQRLHRDRRHQRGPGIRRRDCSRSGISLFLWGVVATTSLPLIAAVLIGHYVFKFHPAILFGVCAGVRTTTAALGMVQEAAKSKVPALGYGMPYAIGNTLLTIFGMVDRAADDTRLVIGGVSGSPGETQWISSSCANTRS